MNEWVNVVGCICSSLLSFDKYVVSINHLQDAIPRTVDDCLIKKAMKETNAYLINQTGSIAIWWVWYTEGLDGKTY